MVGGSFNLAGRHPGPLPDRTEAWIAYGLILDVDGDGKADARIGMDNLSSEEHRFWRTDLLTGETAHGEGATYGWLPEPGGILDTWYPGQRSRHGGWLFNVGRLAGEPGFRFYGWAAQVEGFQHYCDGLRTRQRLDRAIAEGDR